MTAPPFYNPFEATPTRTGRVTAISANGHQVQVLLPATSWPYMSPAAGPLPLIQPVADLQTGWVDLNPVDAMRDDTLVRAGQTPIGINSLVTVTFADDALAQPLYAALFRSRTS